MQVPGDGAPVVETPSTPAPQETSQDVRNPSIEQNVRAPAAEAPEQVQVQLQPQDVPSGNIPAQPVNARSQVEQSFDVRQAELIRSIDEQKRASIQSSMASVSSESPDQAAKAATIAAKLKLPVGVVSRNMATFEKEVRSQATDYDAIVKRFPAVGSFIENPDQAAVVSDDLAAMQRVEQVAKNGSTMSRLGAYMKSAGAQFAGSLARLPGTVLQAGLVQGSEAEFLGMNPLYASPSDYTDAAMSDRGKEATINGIKTRVPSAQRVPDDWINNPAARKFDKLQENIAKEYPEISTDIIGAIRSGNYKDAGAGLLAQVIVNAPQSIALLGAAATGFGLPALGAAGALSASDAMGEAVDAGVSPEEATSFALTSGAAEAVMESLPIGLFKHWEGVISKSVGKESSRRIFADLFKTLISSGVGEAGEEVVTSVAQDAAGYLTGVKKDLTFEQFMTNAINSGLVGGFSGATITAPGAAISGASRGMIARNQAMQERQAIVSRETYLDMGKTATETRLADRQPAMNEAFLGEVTKQNGMEKVFIPVAAFETYFQSKGIDPAQMALALESGKTLDEAKETGAPLEIPYAKFLGSIGKSEHYAGLQNDVKFSNDGLTVNEAKAEKETLAKDVAAEDAKTTTEAEQIRAVERQIEDQLKEAKRQGAKVDPKAAVAFRGIAVLALREGKDPAKALQELGLRINKVDGKLSEADFSDTEKAYFQREGLDYKNIGGNILDASSMFGKQTQEAAPVEGEGGEVVALPKRSPRADSGEPEVPSETPTEEVQAHPLERMKARFGDDKKAIKAIDKAQSPEGPAWVKSKPTDRAGTSIPNYESKPTGVIGDEGISQPHPMQKDAPLDQLAWVDRKYQATLGLIKEHAAEGKSLVINTSSDLVGGSEYIEAMPSDTQVNMYMLTKDPHLNQLIFPGNPSYKRQLAAVEALKEAGVRVKEIQPTVDSVIETVGLEHAMRETRLSEPEVREWLQKSIGLSLVAEKSYNQKSDNLYPVDITDNEGDLWEIDLGGIGVEASASAQVLSGDQYVDQLSANGDSEESQKLSEKYPFNNVLSIESVQVDPEFQGKGYAKKLIASFVSEAENKGLDAVVLNASPMGNDGLNFQDLVGFYASLGFEVVDTADQNATMILPLKDDKARIQRAKDAGFDTSRVVYHGGPAEITEFKTNGKGANKFLEGVYMTPSKNEADRYRGMASRSVDGGEIYSFYPPANLLDLDSESAVDEAIQKIGLEVPKYKAKFKYNPEQDNIMKMRLAVEKHLKGAGEKLGKNVDRQLKAMLQEAGYKGLETKNDQVISVFDPKDVRATEAQFKNLDSSNIFAQSDEGDIKGQIRIGDKEINIDLFNGADISTIFHEGGHLYLHIMSKMEVSENATDKTLADAKAIAEFVGAKDLQNLTVEQHEKFARGFEKYLFEGKAPTQGLKKAFARFKTWLISLYKDPSRLNVELTPEIREVFDRIIASDAEISKAELASGYVPLFNLSNETNQVGDENDRGTNGQGQVGSQVQSSTERLKGLPESSTGPVPGIRDLARSYTKSAGLPYRQQSEFVKADPERGARIAAAFEEMKHDPENPEVKAAYRALIDETLTQFQTIKESGLKFDVITSDMANPYPNGSVDMMADVAKGHIWFLPTISGFGTETTITDNPLLEPTGEKSGDYELVANDVFRIVHDVFGHAKEGNGFGPDGEENAWQSHVRMYSPEAARAMTSETRGQNSWVNFGPNGEANQADPANTTYADQKTGLLPDWALTEGMAKDKEETRPQQASPLFKGARKVGLSDSQAKRLVTAQDEAAAEAREMLTKKLLEAEKKKLTAKYREQAKIFMEANTNYLNNTQVYRAISILQTGRYPDGTETAPGVPPLKLDRSLVDPKKAAIIANKFGTKVFSKETGMGPDVLAPGLGFNDGQDLVDTLVAVLPLNEEAAVRTADQMAAQYPDLMEDPEAMSAEAMQDVHNNSQSKLYKMELDILAENHKATLKDAIRAVAKRSPSTEEVRTQAETFIGDKAVKDINPNFYVRAEQKANREAGELLAKGDIAGAFEAKRRALLNYEMFKAATTAKEQVAKSLEKFKPIYKKDDVLAKNRDMDLVNAARAILGGYGLAKKTAQSPREYLEKIKEYGGEDQYNGLMNLVQPALMGAGKWDEVSYNKFSDMQMAVDAIWELSRDVRQITVDGKKMEIAQAVEELTAQIDSGKKFYETPEFTKDKSDWEKTKMKLLGARAALVRVEHWFRAVDGGKAGAFTNIMFKPVAEGTTKYRTKKNVVMKEFRAVMESIKDRVAFDPIEAPEIGHTFKDKTTLMMAMLHTGNGSNKSKLLRGRNWGEVSEDGTLNTTRWDAFVTRMINEGVLTKAEYDFFQKVWTLMESFKREAQAAHIKIYGYPFSEITAEKIQTPFGEYAGGYVPAKVDIYENMDAEIRAEREAFDAVNSSSNFPTTGRGATKHRVDSYAAPLSLDLTILSAHIDWALRFSYIEAPVKDVARLNINKGLRAKIGEVDPAIVKNAITPWLQRAASQKVVEPSKTGDMIWLDNFAAWARKSAAMQFMFAGAINTIEQSTGVFVAAAAVKPRHLRDAVASYTTNYKQMTKNMVERSEYMANAQDSTIYESQDAVQKIVLDQSWLGDVQEFSKKHTYFMQAAMQNVVNSIVWNAAYNQHIEEGKTEVDAVFEADSAVRRTQGSNNPEDISAFETGTAVKRLFTQFATFFNMIANLNSSVILELSRGIGMRKGAGKMFYVYMFSMAIPAVLGGSLRKLANGSFDEDDDDQYVDDLLSVAFWSQVQYATAMVPWVGQFTNAAINKFNDNFYDDRMSLSPVVSLLESTAGAGKAVYDVVTGDEVTKRDVKDILTAIGFWSATPVGPIGKPVGYLMDVAEGEAEPTSAADFLRGLVTGRKGGSN